jgi:hypothetical protein
VAVDGQKEAWPLWFEFELLPQVADVRLDPAGVPQSTPRCGRRRAREVSALHQFLDRHDLTDSIGQRNQEA